MGWFRKNQNQDTPFMSEVSAAVIESTHGGAQILLYVSLLFFILAGFWAYYTELDEVTRGEGKVVPSSKIQVIQNLEGGILAEVLVSEGQTVQKGQVLLKIDDTRFSSSFRETELKYFQLLMTSRRLEAESEGSAFVPPAEIAENHPVLAQDELVLYRSRQLELESVLQVLEQQADQKRQELVERRSRQLQLNESFELSNQELVMSEPLVEKGVISEVELLRLKRTTNDLRGEMNANLLAIPRIKSSIDEVLEKIVEQKIRFKTDAAKQLSEVKAELARIKETILSLEDRVTRTQVRSPVMGTIKQLKINTVGGIIQPGMDLVEIVPIEDNLLIEAKIRPADIAFLRPGQSAMIKLTAYDFTIYGGLDAKLERISADTILDEKEGSFYLIYLRTDKNYIESANKKRLEIIPGMIAGVDILTGKKSVLDYLLKPILKAKNEAMRER